MSFNSYVSLIDLSKQVPFDIDDQIKKQICFGETLVISCCHQTGNIGEESSESEWSCTESAETDKSHKPKDEPPVVIKDHVEEDTPKPVTADEDNDFHFFFFPDCNKPTRPEDTTASVILIDGVPQVNPAAKPPEVCGCKKDKDGKCDCFVKLPCHCGAKTLKECKCLQVENICICNEDTPRPYCTCKPDNVCMCLPDCKPRPVCTCAQVNKPCICNPEKFPCAVCTCECKPKFIEEVKSEGGHEESVNEEQKSEVRPPCLCQAPDQKPCFCRKGGECDCREDACVCGLQRVCICEPVDGQEPVCKDDDTKSVCSCPVEKECTCFENSPMDCKCFPDASKCTCGDPENCKCFKVCECQAPCLCDITPKKEEDVCTCVDITEQPLNEITCTCPRKELNQKMKRTRAGRHGYRWCRDVDPRHTYFDFAYGRHDKISYKHQEAERMKILGLHEEVQKEETCPIHTVKAPEYRKKVRRPSLDCCSPVGGISISVETLGEDKDKFLVQVVSHSSKEGAKTGSKLVSILDSHLHTLEENRTEHISKKNITKEQRSYMTICENGYYNKVTRICGERHFVKRLYHSFEASHNFLLEGANVVLLRYFAINRYRGNVKTDTVLMDGTICESIYVCLGVSQAIVNGKPMFVVKVERHIVEPSGFIHQTMTVLTLRGYMVSHEWVDNSYIFHLNPLLRVIPEKDEIEQHEPLREKWRNDLQLMSDYLDFKSARSSEGARYVSENGELTAIIRDYLQTLLLLRPHDALHFTRHYFGSALSSLDLPHDDYFNPSMKQVRYFFFEE
ncbi:uncharacterized protein [Epargyreus clarus]|uniref:uncharacterized protein n=1 Tax=Epargyreus clarus TaxID=520877 RepID=UPI003C2B95A2